MQFLYYEFENKNNEKYNLMYMDFIAIAMILRIRDSLKREDQNQCFSILFKYPHIENIIDLIKLSDKVSNAINEQLNGSNSDVYDILGIMKPIESRPAHWNSSGISPHEYNQKNNRKNSIGEKIIIILILVVIIIIIIVVIIIIIMLLVVIIIIIIRVMNFLIKLKTY